MPFVARLKTSQERVCVEDYNNPKIDLPVNELVCQFEDCASPMLVRSGLRMRSHFAHRPSSPCQTKYQSHPESAQHREGKRKVAQWLREDLVARGFCNFKIEFEVAIREAKRVADVLVTFPSGAREAHEIQLSGITAADLRWRTDAYRDEGIDVFWWLGEGSAADTKPNRIWVLDQIGECPVLQFHADSDVLFTFSPTDEVAGSHVR